MKELIKINRHRETELPIAYCLLPIPERNDLTTNKYETVSKKWVANCPLPVAYFGALQHNLLPRPLPDILVNEISNIIGLGINRQVLLYFIGG